MKFMFAGILLALCAACSPRVDTTNPTLNATAIQALSRAALLSSKVEYGGLLYEVNGIYFYTVPVTDNKATSVNVRGGIPRGAKIVGVYHTHPKDAIIVFSGGDVDTAYSMKVPVYMYSFKSGEYRVYYASKHKPSETSPGKLVR